MLSEVCQVHGSPDPGNQLVLMRCCWCWGRQQDEGFPEKRDEGGREGSRRVRMDSENADSALGRLTQTRILTE